MECTSKLILFRKFRKKCFETNAALDTFRMNPIPLIDDVPVTVPDESVNGTIIIDLYDESEKVESTEEDHIINIPSDTFEIECAIDGPDNDTIMDDDEIVSVYLLDNQQTEKFTLRNETQREGSEGDEDQPEMDDISQFDDDIEEASVLETSSPSLQTEYLEDDDLISIATVEPKPKAGTSPFVCPICDSQFSRKYSLNQHMHSHNGVKKFSCDICQQKFSRKPHLTCHMRIHLDVRPFSCPECLKSFIKASDMERHRAVHSDRRPYSCSLCDKRFKRSNDVTAHMFTHTGHKPYKCTLDPPLCAKAYGSHSSLKKHLLKCHGVRMNAGKAPTAGNVVNCGFLEELLDEEEEEEQF